MKLAKISNSEANDWEQCKKRWAFRHLDGIPQPPNKYLDHGSKVHDQIERVLRGEKEAEYSHEIYAQDFIENLDPTEISIETRLEKNIEGVIVNGKYDVFLETDDYKVLIDWKTKEKKPDEIMQSRTYEQLSLYGFLAGLTNGDKIVEVFPEWKTCNVAQYSIIDGENKAKSLVKTAKEILEFKETHMLAKEVRGTPQTLCRYCPYNNICPDKKRG